MAIRPRLRKLAILSAVVVLLALPLATSSGRNLAWSAFTMLRGRASVDDRLREFGTAARDRLRRDFATAGVTYPPSGVALLAFKKERRLDVYARLSDSEPWRRVRTMTIEAASGSAGPKLKSGDGQVPEGIYGVESLNPNSRFHAALRVDYPNDFDREQGRSDGREDLGGDIMIHGGRASIGCLAMGDVGIEDLFVLAADVGVEKVEIVIAPHDLRTAPAITTDAALPWMGQLYERLAQALSRFPM